MFDLLMPDLLMLVILSYLSTKLVYLTMPDFDRLFESMVWHNTIKAPHRYDV